MKISVLPMATALLTVLAGPMAAQTASQQGQQLESGSMDHAAHMAAQADPDGQMPMHSQMSDQGTTPETSLMPTEPGQSAFATIAEIVRILRADPDTDWAQVDIDTLREHLVDMDAVTLKAQVSSTDIDNGAIFDVTSSDPRVTQAIRAMSLPHAATMSGIDGVTIEAVEIAGGARMTATSDDVAMIQGLGFFGVMSLGMHHQAHHIALARGQVMPLN